MKKIKGVILCGGPGVRLRPITYYFQKSMIPVGKHQKPLLELVVRLFKFHGITDLTFLVNYKADQIMNYFDRGSRFDVKIKYVYDDQEMRGTGCSVLNAYRQGVIDKEYTLLVYYGDILSNINLKKLLNFHNDKQASATVALATDFAVRVGLADLDKEGRILGFVEKPRLQKPVSVGIMALEGYLLEAIEHMKKEEDDLDLMKDVVPGFLKTGKPVYGYLSDFFWYDVGSTEAYEKLQPNLVDEFLSYLY